MSTATVPAGAPVRRALEMWGTVITLDVRDPVPTTVLDDVEAWFQRVDDLFSTWRDDTEISRLATGALTLATASPEVRVVLARCEEVRVVSGGAFDITVGARAKQPREGIGPLDPSGLVKGWALERAADILTAAGAGRFAINAGGDVLTRGRPTPDAQWRVGIQHPWQRDKVAAVVAVTDAGVATAGRYERGDHILDPATGEPARGLASVTVIAPDLALADGFATAAMVRGEDGMAWLQGLPDVEAMAITNDRTVIVTAGFARARVS